MNKLDELMGCGMSRKEAEAWLKLRELKIDEMENDEKNNGIMKKFIRKPAIVEAAQFDQPGEYKILHGNWVTFNAGDWLVKANGKSWIVEGDVFSLLYEQIDIDIP